MLILKGTVPERYLSAQSIGSYQTMSKTRGSTKVNNICVNTVPIKTPKTDTELLLSPEMSSDSSLTQ